MNKMVNKLYSNEQIIEQFLESVRDESSYCDGEDFDLFMTTLLNNETISEQQFEEIHSQVYSNGEFLLNQQHIKRRISK